MSRRFLGSIHLYPLLLAGCGSLGGNASAPDPEVGQDHAAIVGVGATNQSKRNYLGTYHPDSGLWTMFNNRPGTMDNNTPLTFYYGGGPTAKPLVGDWNGDGTETQGIWDSGYFLLSDTLGNSFNTIPVFQFGNVDDIPLAGDWDGDGTTTIGVYRPSTCTFFLRNSNTTGPVDIQTTLPSVAPPNATKCDPRYLPVTGDWTGAGFDGIGVFRPSIGFWWLGSNLGTLVGTFTFGAGDSNLPIVGDWDQDGVASVGVMSAVDGTFSLRNYSALHGTRDPGNPEMYQTNSAFAAGDLAIAGDWLPSQRPTYSTAPASLSSFFPIGVFYQQSSRFPTWSSRGINTVVMCPASGPLQEAGGIVDTDPGSKLSNWSTAAVTAGFKMIRPLPRDAGGNYQSTYDSSQGFLDSILAYEEVDEPEAWTGSDYSVSLSTLQTKYSQLNGVKPMQLNLTQNILGAGMTTTEYWGFGDACDGPGDDPASPYINCYGAPGVPGYATAYSDWISVDIYPVTEQGLNLDTIGYTMDKLRRWAPSKPMMAYVEASDIYADGHAPSGAQLNAEVWSAIVHGARGIIYFPPADCNHGDGCQIDDGVTADLDTAMKALNPLITSCASWLQTTVNPSSFGMSAWAPLDVGWRTDGTYNYFIVVNPTGTTQSNAIMYLRGFTPGHDVTRIGGESGTLTVFGSGYFIDTFQPYQTHIYRY